MGLDIGTVRIGVALSDDSGTIASPLTVIPAEQPFEAVRDEVARICEEHEANRLVVGLPLSMSGEGGGVSARAAKKMGKKLGEALGIRVAFIDERFTSVQADRALLGANMGRRKRKGVIDKVAAAILLQAYLDARPDNES